MQIYPFTIFLFSLVIGTMIFYGVREGVKKLRERESSRVVPRRGDYFATAALSNQMSFVMLIFFAWYLDSPVFLDFGYNGDFNSVVFCLFLGSAAYFALIGAYKLFVRAVGLQQQLLAEAYLVHRTIYPRSVMGRRKLLAVLLINPFTEEIIYRGFLVYYLGNLFDSIWLFSFLGLLVCLIIHLYQGARMLPFHVTFCIASILILFSPAGIVACFGFHLAGDLYPMTELKRSLSAWRNMRRRQRQPRGRTIR